MKLSVYIRGEIIAIPCGSGTDSVKTLGELAIRKYSKLKPTSSTSPQDILEIRRRNGGAVLDPEDAIKDVLDDNDFVTVGET